jgi:hypothetical protein
MKKTAQVRHNTSTKQPPSQPQTASSGETVKVKSPFDTDFDLPINAPHDACLCFFSRESQIPIAKIRLGEKEFSDFINTLDEHGGEYADFVADAIREKLARLKGPEFGWDHEINNAMLQSQALSELFLIALREERDGTYCDDIQVGMQELTWSTERRLAQAIAKEVAS